MTRFLAVADLHLGAHPQYGDDRLAEQEAVWTRAVELALAERCDAVLFGGDAFEGPLPTPEQYLAFARPLRALTGAIPVIGIPGNGKHDSAMRARNALEVLEAGYAPNLLTVHSRPGVTKVDGVSVVCLPWAPVGRLVAEHNGHVDRDDINALASELLLNIARGFRAEIDGPAILLTHYSIGGAALPNGLPVADLREPVLDQYELEALGYEAVVAGHIHKPQPLFAEGCGFYCGSPMPLSFGEADTEHGVFILDLPSGNSTAASAPGAQSLPPQPGDAGSTPASRFIPIKSRRFVTLEYGRLLSDWQGEPPFEPFQDQLNDGSFVESEDVSEAICKLRYHATSEQARQIDEQAIRRALEGAGAHRIYIERVPVAEQRRARVEGLDEHLDAASAVEMWLASGEVEPEQAAAIRERHEAYTRELAAA